MQVAEYIVDELIKYGVTDTFGIPGGVILRFLAAMERRKPELIPHLNYHEQMAGFSACGYAQASGKLGVAYATRGPGITNMITSMAEAYQESLPVLFITAHGNRSNHGMRFENNQELDIINMVSGITKFASNVETVEDVEYLFHKTCDLALEGRKGPVLLDFSSSLWNKEINCSDTKHEEEEINDFSIEALKAISEEIKCSKQPVILIGDGIRHAIEKHQLYELAEKIRIPVLSSRGAQDLLSGSPYYFGYLGSHGTRYSNFILSKADLIIAIGNRLAFPVDSASFAPIVKKARMIRLDIDENEFERKIQGAETYKVNSQTFLNKLLEIDFSIDVNTDWIDICNRLREELNELDCTEPVLKLASLISKEESETAFVCDVGNNEFWFARAFEKIKNRGTVLYSKSYGTLGAALGRAIGVYYAIRKPVICILGDQGFQYNLQEIQYIVQWRLPIKVVVLNNSISGMITDHEKKMLGDNLIHVNSDTGYLVPDFQKIISGYGLKYTKDELEVVSCKDGSIFYEIVIDPVTGLSPNLPKGNACQDMEPLIERDKYDYLNQL